MPLKKKAPKVPPAAVVDSQTVALVPVGPVRDNQAEQPGTAESAAEPRESVEALAEMLSTPRWLFAAAKVMHNWPEGQLLTVTDYDAALDAAGNEVIA